MWAAGGAWAGGVSCGDGCELRALRLESWCDRERAIILISPFSGIDKMAIGDSNLDASSNEAAVAA